MKAKLPDSADREMKKISRDVIKGNSNAGSWNLPYLDRPTCSGLSVPINCTVVTVDPKASRRGEHLDPRSPGCGTPLNLGPYAGYPAGQPRARKLDPDVPLFYRHVCLPESSKSCGDLRGSSKETTMATFIDQFAACVQRESSRVALSFGSSADEELEQTVQQGVQQAWRPLLPPEGEAQSQSIVAIDGSQAIRYFNNGWLAIICHALCVGVGVGVGIETPTVQVKFARNTLPEAVLNRYAGTLMRYLEIRAALDSVDKAAGGVMCLDGSLHTALPHLLYQLPWEEESDLPLLLLESYLDLLDACTARRVLLISLSKTSMGSMLAEALLRLDETSALPGDIDLDDWELPPLPSDMEAIYRWTRGAGASRSVVLGSYGFGNRRGQLLHAPEQLARGFHNSRFTFAERLSLLHRLSSAPATVATYVRLRDHEDSIRLDVPASAVGLPDRIRDTYLGWADHADMAPALGHLLGSYGGTSVYHAALYVADQLVRLHNSVVDTAYLSIIRAKFGAFVQYDRSRRRFL